MRRRTLSAAVMAGAVLVAGGGVAFAQVQGTDGSYRTAVVTEGDVDRTISLAGTISASARRDLSFGVAGTVADVEVSAGDIVRSGADLATLDPTSLEAGVTRANAALAKALAQLESDQSSQAAAVTSASTESASSSSAKDATSSESSDASRPSPALTKALAQLATQQKAVTESKSAATAAITSAKEALTAQIAACHEVADDLADSGAPDAEDADESGDSAGLTAQCQTALGAVQAAQDIVAERQDELQTALGNLSETLTDAITAVQESTASSASPSTGASTPNATESTGGGSGSGGAVVSAATLARDQAVIDTARASLTEAERLLEGAAMTAPFAGKVLSVSVVEGDAVGASDVVIVMVGNGDTTATTTVTTDQIADVAKDQVAMVTPAGASKPVEGVVTSIGLLPESGTDTTAYPVTIELSDEVAAPEGSTASIALVTGTAEGVLTVPSSAISTVRGTTTTVLTDGEVVRTPVTVGVVGPARTEITTGLKAGQVVVLADLDVALPSGDGETTTLPGVRGGQGGQGGPGGQGGQGRAR